MQFLKIKHLFTFSLVFLIFQSNNCKAQKCSYEKNVIDGVTNVAIKRTNPEILLRLNNQPLYIKAQSIGNNKYLKIRYYKYNNFSIQENKEISFILTNGKEVVLYPRIMPRDTTNPSDFAAVSSLLVYKLSEEQANQLGQTPVQAFKYNLISGWVNINIKTSKQIKIMNILHCVE